MTDTRTSETNDTETHSSRKSEQLRELVLDEEGDVVSMEELEHRLNKWGIKIERHSEDSDEAEGIAEGVETDEHQVVEFRATGSGTSPIIEHSLPVWQAYESVKSGELLDEWVFSRSVESLLD